MVFIDDGLCFCFGGGNCLYLGIWGFYTITTSTKRLEERFRDNHLLRTGGCRCGFLLYIHKFDKYINIILTDLLITESVG